MGGALRRACEPECDTWSSIQGKDLGGEDRMFLETGVVIPDCHRCSAGKRNLLLLLLSPSSCITFPCQNISVHVQGAR